MPFMHGRNSPTCNPEAAAVGYEIAHAHPADNSLHVLLSPVDACTVIEAAWGRRFAVPSMVPPGWVSLMTCDLCRIRRRPMLT